jgi:polysaccharide chain length determinant protein (PEP-CTERM system associated)
MPEAPMRPNDFFEIVKRRKWSLILPMVIIFLAGAVVALALPSIYKSVSTILIEEQEIPDNFVSTMVSSYAEQRLQSINQRIMSSSRLLEIINRYNLYADLREKWTTEEIVEKMSEDIALEPISAEVMDRRTGRPSAVTIAFTLSYEGKNPTVVQQVSNMLASLFLSENIKVREQQTKETFEFLENELNKIKTELQELDTKIATFKEQNINALPELLPVNIQSLNALENNIERLNQQLRSLKEHEGYLRTQLAGIPPDEETKRDEQRLEDLKVQLAMLRTRYSEEYPDVKKTTADIEELEKKLAQAQKSDNPDNPAYVTLASQLASTRADINSVKRQIREFEKKADNYRNRVEATPRVEESYQAMVNERNNLQAKFNDMMSKVMESRVAQGLEKEQKGERFTLIDPARLPEKPFKPNRLAIMLIGVVLGIGAGIGLASLREFTDDTVWNADQLARIAAYPILAGIPEIPIQSDISRRRMMRLAGVGVFLLVIAAGLVVFHYLVMDLDVFWAKLMRKLAI